MLLPFLFRRLHRLVQVPGLFCWVHCRMSYRRLPCTRELLRLKSSLRNGSKASGSWHSVGCWSQKCRSEAYHTERYRCERKTRTLFTRCILAQRLSNMSSDQISLKCKLSFEFHNRIDCQFVADIGTLRFVATQCYSTSQFSDKAVFRRF